MSSIAQVEANRTNAQKSTGPRTPEGVAACCRNATRHGLFSSRPLAPGESAEEFTERRRTLLEDLAPQGAAEELLADRAISQAWRLRRVTQMMDAMLEEALPVEAASGRFPTRPDAGTDREATRTDADAGREATRPEAASTLDALRRLDLLRRYERTIEQGLHQALRELGARQKARRDEARRTRQEEERRAIAQAAAARQKELDERRRTRDAEEKERRLLRQEREEAQCHRRESQREVEWMIAKEEAIGRALERHPRRDEDLAEEEADAA